MTIPASPSSRTRLATVLGLVWIYLILFVHVLDTAIVNLSLVTIARDLRIDVYEGKWLVTSFGIGMAVAIAMSPQLADWAGERVVFSWALLASALASAACGFADNLQAMVLLRVAHGFASGMIIIVGQSLMVDIVGKHRKAFGLSLWTSVISMAPVAGPLVGALVIQYLSWRWLFWMNVPLISLAVLVRSRELQLEPRRSGPPPRIVPPLMVGVLLLGLQTAIDLRCAPAAFDPIEMRLAVAAVLVGGFLLTGYHVLAGHALFRWHVLRNTDYLAYMGCTVLVNGLLLTTSVAYPLWLQVDYGLPLGRVAAVLASGGIIACILSPMIGRIKARWLFPWMVISSLWLLAWSSWLISELQTDSSFGALVLPRVLVGLALALYAPANFLAVATLSDRDFLAAHALSMFARSAAGSLIVSASTGLMWTRNVSAFETIVGSGDAAWFRLDQPADVAALTASMWTRAHTESLHAFFFAAAIACVVLAVLLLLFRASR